MEGVTNSFISLDEKSGDCKEVAQVVTGSYTADMYGRWDTNPNYDDSIALYHAQFLGYTRTTDEYKADMNRIVTEIKQIGEKVCIINLHSF